MGSPITISLLPLVSLLLLNDCYLVIGDGNADSFLRKACNTTDTPQVCIQVLESDPRSLSANLKGLCRIGMEITATKAKENLSYVNVLLKNAKDNDTRETLTECSKWYDTCVIFIGEEGLRLFDAGDYWSAEHIMLYGSDIIYQCDASAIDPPLLQRNQLISSFSHDIMELLQLLQKSMV